MTSVPGRQRHRRRHGSRDTERGATLTVDDLAAMPSEELLRAGGWNPLCARLLRVETFGEEALVLVDTNGDGKEIEVEFWRRAASWDCLGSAGLGSGGYSGSRGGLLWTVGRAQGRASVRVAHGAAVSDLPVDENGYWVLAEDREPDDEYPVVVG